MSVCYKAVPDGYLPASDPAQLARLSQTSPPVWPGKFDDVLQMASATVEVHMIVNDTSPRDTRFSLRQSDSSQKYKGPATLAGVSGDGSGASTLH